MLCPWRGTDCRPLLLRRRAGRPQLKRDPLGRVHPAMQASRTVVTFQSGVFNTTERRPYVINDACYGDDVARWIISELNLRGIPSDPEPGQEDFGWYVTYRPGQAEHQLVLGYRPGDDKDPAVWLGWVERNAGTLASLLGARRRGIEPVAVEVIHDILSRGEFISRVRWYRKSDFDAGNEANASTQPDAA